MTSPLRPLLGIGAVVVLLGGTYLLREATMSTHYRTGPGTRLHVVVDAASNRPEPGHTLEELTRAHVTACSVEVDGRHRSEITPVAGHDDRFTITLQPALDSTDRKQYRGCLEDWSVDHHLLRVRSMTEDDGS